MVGKKTIALVCILPLFAFIKADWFTQSLDTPKVSIAFPLKPERIVQANGTVAWRYANDVSTCMVSVIDLTTMGMDSASLKEMLDDPESLEDFKNGILGEIKGAKTVAEAALSKLNGYPCYEVAIDMSKSQAEADKDIMYNKSVFVGIKLYGLYYHEKKGKVQEAERKQFFNSFNVSK